MKRTISTIFAFAALFVFAGSGYSQTDDICGEFGLLPSLDSPFAQVPYIYGRITVKGVDRGAKFPKVTITLLGNQQQPNRLIVERSGNYCFKSNGRGGTLVIEVDGVEAIRKTLPMTVASKQREDFEIQVNGAKTQAPPATISAKFSHPQNEKTIELYKKFAEAEGNKDHDRAMRYLKEIVLVDPADFIAWAQLGAVNLQQNSLADAEAAFRKSLELKPEYTTAWLNMGKIRAAQKQFEAAIEIFKYASTLDPSSARTFQLLGEAYLQARKGTLGVEALNEAIRLDPVGMAECHLLIARLYDLAGAKPLAAREYKMFLTKVPEHPDKKKLERYVKENPE